jgi:DUF1680 family protein
MSVGSSHIISIMKRMNGGDDPSQFWAKTYHYCQAHVPIREQTGATGHSVRACYLYAGVADLAAETGDPTLIEASASGTI